MAGGFLVMVAVGTFTVFRNCWFPKRREVFLLVDLAQWCVHKKERGGRGGGPPNPNYYVKIKNLISCSVHFLYK